MKCICASQRHVCSHRAEKGAIGRVCVTKAVAIGLVMAGSLSAVDIYPGTNIQSVVNSNAAGTVYTLKSGVHRTQTINPKSGDTYQGESGTILSGALQLATFSRSGSYWVATNQNQRGSVNSNVTCQSGWDGCQYPEQLYIDDVPLQHVTSLGAVTSGKWYFDYNARSIYLMDDPTGRKVETSLTARAFTGNGVTNVKIQNLTIEKYASPSQDGAIAPGNGWTIQNCEIRLSQGIGVRLQAGMRLLNTYVHHNGQIGVAGDGDSVVVDGNEIAYNNTAHFDYAGTTGEAGGTKFAATTNLLAQNNYVHDNIGPALWLDGNNYAWTIQSNRTANNLESGIFDEISYDGIIRYNVLENEGNKPGAGSSFWYRSAILVASSSNAEVYGNLLINSANGIGAIANNRGSGNRGTYTLQNFYVHDNTMVQSTGYVAGIVADSAYMGAYTSQNNRFVNNIYKLSNAGGAYYTWAASGAGNYSDMTSSQWKAAGQDTGGTWLDSSSTVPSTQFSTGSRVSLATNSAVRSLPTTSGAGAVVGNLSAGAGGAVTGVRGPIYADGNTWWQVAFDSGAKGWVPVSALSGGGGSPPPPPPPPPSSDTVKPSMGIAYPYNNSTVSGTVAVSGVASDNVGVVKVEWYVDNALQATNFSTPYGFSWNTAGLSGGSHSLKGVAYDAAGNTDYGIITVTINSPLPPPPPSDTVKPSIGIAYPYNNSLVYGTVTVSGIATDNVGVVRVEWYIDNVVQATNFSTPYGFTWNTAGYSRTSHSIKGVAYDAAGNSDYGIVTVTIF